MLFIVSYCQCDLALVGGFRSKWVIVMFSIQFSGFDLFFVIRVMFRLRLSCEITAFSLIFEFKIWVPLLCMFVFFVLGWFALPFQPKFILTESILCPVLSHSMRLYFDGSIWSGEGFENVFKWHPFSILGVYESITIHHDDLKKKKLTWYWSLGFSQSKKVKKFEIMDFKLF